MAPSTYQAQVVDSQASINLADVNGKTVVITGASGGLGFAYARALADAGATVVNGDIKPPTEATSESVFFAQCDVTKWEDQVNLFKHAKAKSPNETIDIVIANAAVYGPDALTGIEDDEPSKPETKVLEVDLFGVLYTTKLAGWYFHHQKQSDPCLVLITSIMGYIDTQGSSVYSAAKHGVRGLMACLRRKGLVRVNCLAPWFIATPILPESFTQSAGGQFRSMGVDFASTEDATSAVLRLVTDKSINGRTLAVVPRQISESGYIDLEKDDFKPGEPLHLLQSVASSLVYGKFGSS